MKRGRRSGTLTDKRVGRLVAVAALAGSAAVLGGLPAASATSRPSDITASDSAATLAAAIVADPSTLVSASFVVGPNGGNPTATATGTFGTTIAPVAGSTMAVLSNGDATAAQTDSTQNITGGEPSNKDNSPNVAVRGGYDVTILQLNLTAPAYANCLGVNLDYFTSDIPTDPPESIMTGFADGMFAELDPTMPWSIADEELVGDGYLASSAAPADFAVDAQGYLLDSYLVANPGAPGAPTNDILDARGTPYAEASGWYAAFTPVTPGSHVVDLSIFDRGDDNSDSTVLVNGLSFFNAGADCLAGLEAAIPDTAPTVTIDGPLPAKTTATTPTFDGSFGTDYQDLPEVSVNVYAGSSATGSPIQTLPATDTGSSWSATVSQPLAPGTYTVQAQQSDFSGDVGVSSADRFTVEASLAHSGSLTKRTVRESATGKITVDLHNPNSIGAAAKVSLVRTSLKVGHRDLTVAAHATTTVTIRLSKKARAYLTSHHSLKTKATIVLTAHGTSKTAVETVTIKAAH